MINGFLLSDEDAIYHWPEIEKFLKPVVEMACGEFDEKTLFHYVSNGQNKVIGIFDSDKLIAACILAVTIYDTGKKTLQVPHIGGVRLHEWIDKLWSMVQAIAKNMGCSHIRVCGRPGWEKIAKTIDPTFKKIYVTYESEV